MTEKLFKAYVNNFSQIKQKSTIFSSYCTTKEEIKGILRTMPSMSGYILNIVATKKTLVYVISQNYFQILCLESGDRELI